MPPSEQCHVEPVERDPVDEEELRRAATVWMEVSDMGCPNCAHRVRNALLGVPGVLDARVHLGARTAAVAYDDGRATTEEMVAAVAAAGTGTRHVYRATVLDAR